MLGIPYRSKPPTRSARSKTVTQWPAWLSWAAAQSPAGPEPTTAIFLPVFFAAFFASLFGRGLSVRDQVLVREMLQAEADKIMALDGATLRNLEILSPIHAEDDKGTLIGFTQLYPTFCSVRAAHTFVLYDLFVTPAAREAAAHNRASPTPFAERTP